VSLYLNDEYDVGMYEIPDLRIHVSCVSSNFTDSILSHRTCITEASVEMEGSSNDT
jgi:hypothetical protein